MPQQPLLLQPPSPPPPDALNGAKMCLVYKLLLLESARNALDRDLRHFTDQAHMDVNDFLSTGQPTNSRDNIVKAIEVKCHVIQQLSAAFKNLTADPQSVTRDPWVPRGPASQLEPPRTRGLMSSDVLKFGPMLQNILMAGSISRAVQVLGATLSLQQLHLHLSSQPESQTDLFLCSVASSSRHTVLETPRPPDLNGDKQAQKIICQEETYQSFIVKPAPDLNSNKQAKKIICQAETYQSLIVKPAPASQVAVLKPPPPRKPIVTGILPYLGKTPGTPVLPSARLDTRVQVWHQKQTSSQLVHFLRSDAKNKHIVGVTYEKTDYIQYTASISLADMAAISPPLEGRRNKQAREGETLEQRGRAVRRHLLSEMETQTPVFTVKRVDAGGSTTYTCMIASKTELWDVGDIFTGEREGSGKSFSSSEEETSLLSCGVASCSTPAPLPSSCSLPQTTECNLERDPQISTSLAVDHPSVPEFRHLSVPEFHHLSIPEFQIRKFEEMAVMVSHIVSPGNFYIQHADSIQKLKDLSTELEAAPSFAELQSIPDLGAYVMGWFPTQECWCRAKVTKICGMSGDGNDPGGVARVTNIQVEVRRLDFGDTSILSHWDIKKLCPEMMSLPLQAMQVSLVNVVPVDGPAWTQQAVDWFRGMAENRTLFARLYPRPGKASFQVELFMEKGNMGAMRRGASLSLRLAQNGHAKHKKLKNVGIIKRSSAQEQTRAWEKYLISCYTQNKNK